MNRKKGFTLVELLAVIIVLGLILVIAVPSVNKYLKSSKEILFFDDIEDKKYALSISILVLIGNIYLLGPVRK